MPDVYTVLTGGAALRGLPTYADGDFAQPTQLEADVWMDEDRPILAATGTATLATLEKSDALPSLETSEVLPELETAITLPTLTTSVALTPSHYY